MIQAGRSIVLQQYPPPTQNCSRIARGAMDQMTGGAVGRAFPRLTSLPITRIRQRTVYRGYGSHEGAYGPDVLPRLSKWLTRLHCQPACQHPCPLMFVPQRSAEHSQSAIAGGNMSTDVC